MSDTVALIVIALMFMVFVMAPKNTNKANHPQFMMGGAIPPPFIVSGVVDGSNGRRNEPTSVMYGIESLLRLIFESLMRLIAAIAPAPVAAVAAPAPIASIQNAAVPVAVPAPAPNAAVAAPAPIAVAAPAPIAVVAPIQNAAVAAPAPVVIDPALVAALVAALVPALVTAQTAANAQDQAQAHAQAQAPAPAPAQAGVIANAPAADANVQAGARA